MTTDASVAPPVTSRPKKRRRWLRISLRTLLLASLLAGSFATLWVNKDPWVVAAKFPDEEQCDVVFSPRGRYAAFLSSNWSVSEIGIIDLQQNARVFFLPATERVRQIQFSNDEKRLLAIGDQRTEMYVWEVATRRQLRTLDKLSGNRGTKIEAAEFSPDGSSVLVVDQGDAYEWDLASGEVRRCLPEVDGSLRQAHYCRGGTAIWWNQNELEINVSDRKTDQLLSNFPVESFVAGAMLSPDDERLVVYSYEKVQCWDLQTGKTQATALPQTGNQQRVSPDGRRFLYTQRVDGPSQYSMMLTVHDAMTGAKLSSFGVEAWEPCISFSPDSNRILVGTSLVHVYDAVSGDVICEFGTVPVPRAMNPFDVRSTDLPLDLSADGVYLHVPYRSEIYRRRHSEYGLGVTCLPEFWLTVVLVLGLVASVVRDWRM